MNPDAIAQRIERIEERTGALERHQAILQEAHQRMDHRQEKMDDLQRKHEKEFAETRTYVKETYNTLRDLNASIKTLEKTTIERIDRQERYFREEQKAMTARISGLEIANAGDGGDDKEGGSGVLNFSWKVIAGVFALAMGLLAIVRQMGGGTP